MGKFRIFTACAALLFVAGCMASDGERAVVGGLGGALVADALGGNVVAGAGVGAAAGALCDDAGVCY